MKHETKCTMNSQEIKHVLVPKKEEAVTLVRSHFPSIISEIKQK